MGRTAVLCALSCCACGFDSGGVAGSGALQGESDSSASTDGSVSTSATMDATDTGASTAAASDASATTGTSSASDDATDSATSLGTSSTGEDGPAPFGPFGDPVELVDINTNASDDDPTLSPDLLEMYFASLREGGQGSEDVWRVTRASREASFGNPEVVTVLNSTGQDGWPELSHDGLVLTLGSDRLAAGYFDVFVSVRATLADQFPAPTLATDLSMGDSQAAAVMSATMLEAFLCAPIGPTSDLWFATRVDAGAMFGAPMALGSVNSTGRDCTPFLDESGTRLLFSSDRLGTAGAVDLWIAERSGGGDTFAEAANVDAVNVAALNSIWDDDDPWWAADGSALYFSSARGDGGDLDLWVAVAR